MALKKNPKMDGHQNDELEKGVLTDVLRSLHAVKAADMATQSWEAQGSGGEQLDKFYLIERSDLRNFYGPTIGRIANSHWWSVSKVESEFNKYLGALPNRTKSTVDLLKISLLLRVADALHLDSRRAPPFVRALDRPQGVSALHWDFQGRLAFPHLKGDAIVFTAGEPCRVEGAGGWWLAFDALNLADRELRDADLMLRENGRCGLAASRIVGASDPRELAKFVPVQGWRPVETGIRISDVPRIVEILGGENLYGNDANAPLRELIQNAIDAVQARRRLQNRPDWGSISVALENRDGANWLIVEDNGIGMSEQILAGTLLDFGTSLWRSAGVAHEFPGLAAKGMSAIGRFGIGFFSVFMIADEVRVTTRRFDRASSEGLTLTFKEGVGSRPILTEASAPPIDGGTRVELKLIHSPKHDYGIEFLTRSYSPEQFRVYYRREENVRSLAALVAYLAPTSDVTLEANDFGTTERAVEAGDWRTISANAFRQRLGRGPSRRGAKFLESLIQVIADNEGVVYGRAALWPSDSSSEEAGAITSGGMRIRQVPHIVGVVLGEVTNAARSSGKALIPADVLADWATDQGKRISKCSLADEHKAESAEIILECGGEIGDLPIARRGDDWLTTKELLKYLKSHDEVSFYVGDVDHDDDDNIGRSNFENNFEYNKEIIFLPEVSSEFLSHGGSLWPRRRSRMLAFVEDLVKRSWGEFVESNDFVVVGEVGFEEIYRSVTAFTRGG